MLRRLQISVPLLICLLLKPISDLGAAPPAQVSRISFGYNGAELDDDVYNAAISADGNWLAFDTAATNVVPDDSNGVIDVFLYSRLDATIKRISVDSYGAQAAGGTSTVGSISATGNYVVFKSGATNLVANDTNGKSDCFIYERATGIVTRVAAGLVEPNGTCRLPTVTDSGLVVFESDASNLVAGDSGSYVDIFLYDHHSGVTERVSVNSQGMEANSDSIYSTISQDGRTIAFTTFATNFLEGAAAPYHDLLVLDRDSGELQRVGLSSGGAIGDGTYLHTPSLSDDGRFVAFLSFSANLAPNDNGLHWDCFLRDRQENTTVRISQDPFGASADVDSFGCNISGDGSFLVISTGATNLTAAQPSTSASHVFTKSLESGEIALASATTSGESANSDSFSQGASSDATWIAYLTDASNLAANDSAGFTDLFLMRRDLCPDDPDKADPGVCGCGAEDLDANQNGAADCLDPGPDLTPLKSVVSKKKRRVLVEMQQFTGKVTYRLVLRGRDGSGRYLRKRTTDSSLTRLRGLPHGRWNVRYRVGVGKIFSKSSARTRFRIK